MRIKNYYIHHGDNYKEIETKNFHISKINNLLEHLMHYEEVGYTYTNDVFRVINTNIIFSVDDYAGITEDNEEVSVHMAKTEETEIVGRTLRINKTTHKMCLTPIYDKQL